VDLLPVAGAAASPSRKATPGLMAWDRCPSVDMRPLGWMSEPQGIVGSMAKQGNPGRRRGSEWTENLANDTIDGMTWGQVELEPEVADWLEGLDDQRWAQALFHLDLLEERGALLGEPYTRQLSGKLRELRLYCGGERIRITDWIAPGRRIIALTVFAKTRMRERAEISRAARAMDRCQRDGHTPDEDDEQVEYR
jgi:hypothetical protein